MNEAIPKPQLDSGKRPDDSHTISGMCFRVEVRAAFNAFTLPDGTIVDREWKPLRLEARVTVPANIVAPNCDQEDALTRTMDYYAAVAVAAGFMSHYPWRAEARIVRYKRRITWTLERDEGAEIVLEEAVLQHALRRVPDSAGESREDT